MELSLLALIPARGGSKGIKRKNIKELVGKPLIFWTIDAARKARCVDRIVVTTDDDEIAGIALNLDAEVPFMRPRELALDSTPGIDPVIHAIENLPKYDWILLLQPTSPLRVAEDIEAIYKLCVDNQSPSAVSVTEVGSNHPYWMYGQDQNGYLYPFVNNRPVVSCRQSFPRAYSVNGALYLARTDWLLRGRSFIGPETLGYTMPRERSVDLDTDFDWRMAELLMRTS